MTALSELYRTFLSTGTGHYVSHKQSSHKRCSSHAAYEPVNDPQLIAMQKMQKLHELQRRKDYTEKYYTQQINRLIGNQLYESKVAGAAPRMQNRLYAPNYAGDRGIPIDHNVRLMSKVFSKFFLLLCKSQ